MKGPHFFEKRKKEMAKAQKAKEKADRKAQRKAGGGKAEDEFLDADGLPIEAEGQSEGDGGATEGALREENEGGPPSAEVQPEHVPAAAGALRGNAGG